MSSPPSSWSISVRTVGSSTSTPASTPVPTPSTSRHGDSSSADGAGGTSGGHGLKGDANNNPSTPTPTPTTPGGGSRDSHHPTFTVDVDPDDSITTLQDAICDVTGLTVDRQRLIYRGKIISGGATAGTGKKISPASSPSSAASPPGGDGGIANDDDDDDDDDDGNENEQSSSNRSARHAGIQARSVNRRIRDVAGLGDGQTIHLVPRPPPAAADNSSSSAAAASAPSSAGLMGGDDDALASAILGGSGSGGSAGTALLAALLGLGSLGSFGGGGGGGGSSNNDEDDDSEGDNQADLDGVASILTGGGRLPSPPLSSPAVGAATTQQQQSSRQRRPGGGRRRSSPSTAHVLTARDVAERSARDRAGTLEPVRQGLMTVHTLLHGSGAYTSSPTAAAAGACASGSTRHGEGEGGVAAGGSDAAAAAAVGDNAANTASSSSSSSPTSAAPPPRRFYRGQWVDVLDTVNQWLEATVVDVVTPQDVLGIRCGDSAPRVQPGGVGGESNPHRHRRSGVGGVGGGGDGSGSRAGGGGIGRRSDPIVGANDWEGRRLLLLDDDDDRDVVEDSAETGAADSAAGEEEDASDPFLRGDGPFILRGNCAGDDYHHHSDHGHDESLPKRPPPDLDLPNVQLLLIHYNGWPHRWDEWIRSDSVRVRPFRTRTRHVAGPGRVGGGTGGGAAPRPAQQQQRLGACPAVRSTFHAAPSTRIVPRGSLARRGRDGLIANDDDDVDRAAVLAELRGVLKVVDGLLGAAVVDTASVASASARANVLSPVGAGVGTGTGRHGNIGEVFEDRHGGDDDGPCDEEEDENYDDEDDQRHLPWLSHPPTHHPSDGVPGPNRTDPYVASLDPRTRLRTLAPLIDRIGRVMTDAAPHVAALAESLNTSTTEDSKVEEEEEGAEAGALRLEGDGGEVNIVGDKNDDEDQEDEESDEGARCPPLQEAEVQPTSADPWQTEPDLVDFVNGMVNTSPPPPGSNGVGAGGSRLGRARGGGGGDSSSSLGSALLAAFLASNMGGGEGGEGGDGDDDGDSGGERGGGGGPRVIRVGPNDGNNGGAGAGSGNNPGIDIHVHMLVTGPGGLPPGAAFGLGDLGGDLAPPTTAPTTTDANAWDDNDANNDDGWDQTSTPTRPPTANDSRDGDADDDLFSELYTETPPPASWSTPQQQGSFDSFVSAEDGGGRDLEEDSVDLGDDDGSDAGMADDNSSANIPTPPQDRPPTEGPSSLTTNTRQQPEPSSSSSPSSSPSRWGRSGGSSNDSSRSPLSSRSRSSLNRFFRRSRNRR